MQVTDALAAHPITSDATAATAKEAERGMRRLDAPTRRPINLALRRSSETAIKGVDERFRGEIASPQYPVGYLRAGPQIYPHRDRRFLGVGESDDILHAAASSADALARLSWRESREGSTQRGSTLAT